MQEAADEASEEYYRNECLILAASTGFLSEAEQLISNGASVQCRDKEGTPLLHFTAGKHKVDIVKLLIAKGCDLDVEDKSGRTALHFAASANAHEVVKLFIKSGAWLDAYDVNDDTALHLAIRGHHLDSVRHLIMGKAETRIVNRRGLTALGEAIVSKNEDIVQLLLEKGADVHHVHNGFSLLHLAAGVGDVAIVTMLLQHLKPDAVDHPGGVTPLHCASMKHVSASVVSILTKSGFNPHSLDKDERLALDWAQDDGQQDEKVIKLLKGTPKQRRQNRHRTTVTEIEPADGPETEWTSFQQMSHMERLKQVEIWARAKEEYLSGLAFLDDDSRMAVAAVGNFMRKLECQMAIEKLRNDEDFQTDALDDEVQKAVAECTENPQKIRKFASNEKVMGVLIKLKRLQDVLRRNGRMRVVYEDLLGHKETSQNPNAKESVSIDELQKALSTAKEAVVKAVLGGAFSGKKTEEGGSWWNKDVPPHTDTNSDGAKISTWAFTKSIIFQFFRQFLFALMICVAMVVAMYVTDSLPAPNPKYATNTADTHSGSHPAHVTDDKSLHQRINMKNFPVEL